MALALADSANSAAVATLAKEAAAATAGDAGRPNVEERPLTGRERRAPITLDQQALLSGEVELRVAATVELKLLSDLYECLQTTPDLKVLSTRGAWDGSATIMVLLEQPLPLIDVIISKMPGIVATAEAVDAAGPMMGPITALAIARGARETRRIWLDPKANTPA